VDGLVSATVLVVVAESEVLVDGLPLVELVEIGLLVDAGPPDSVVEDVPTLVVEIETVVEGVAPMVDGVEVDRIVDVFSPIVVVEVETLELEGVLDEADVPPFELVDEVLVPSAVFEVEDTAGDVGGFVEIVVVCCVLLVVVDIGETLPELDVV
jgi:hypothetical protein